MEQRDLLKDQIEQLGKVLAQVLSNFLGLKSDGKASLGIEQSNHQLKDKLDLDIKELLTLSNEVLKDYLVQRHFNAEHLESLAEYLKQIAINESPANSNYLSKAIELLDIADEISNSISFDRINQKNVLKALL